MHPLTAALLFLLTLPGLPRPAQAAELVPVSIQDAGTTYTADLYLPTRPATDKSPLPLVVVIHEWWGKTDYPAQRGKKIADDLGYAALVVDLYGGKTTESAQEAGELAAPFYKDPQISIRRLRSFVAAAAKAQPSVDVSRTAALGYCFGGTQALNLARAGGLSDGAKLVTVVAFHATLASSLQATQPIRAKLLVLHGAADPLVKPAEVAAFKKEMKKARAPLTFLSYPGATHAFSNPKATELGKKNQIPVAYNEKADLDSWKTMDRFLTMVFRGR